MENDDWVDEGESKYDVPTNPQPITKLILNPSEQGVEKGNNNHNNSKKYLNLGIDISLSHIRLFGIKSNSFIPFLASFVIVVEYSLSFLEDQSFSPTFLEPPPN